MKNYIESEEINVFAFPRSFLFLIRPLLIENGVEFTQKGESQMTFEDEEPLASWNGVLVGDPASFFI